MKKYRVIALVLTLGATIWLLSGGVSSSKEKSAPKALWSAISSDNTNSGNLDDDRDGLTNDEEKKYGTDPKNPDTDGDGFLDGAEVKSGFDPLRAAPNDRMAVNSNANTNTNGNQGTQNAVLLNNSNNNNVNSSGGILVVNSNSNSASTSSENSAVNSSSTQVSKDRPNLTADVQNKMDSLITDYKLYANTYDALPEADRTNLDKEISLFVGEMVKSNGLDFAFTIPDEELKINSDGGKNWPEYLEETKTILKENGLMGENQIIEDGIKDITLELANMSRGDLDWDRLANLKSETDKAYQQIVGITVNPNLKNTHVQLLRVIKSLEIVLDNVDQNDYFRSYLATGRAGKIDEEIQKFSLEAGKN